MSVFNVSFQKHPDITNEIIEKEKTRNTRYLNFEIKNISSLDKDRVF